MNTTRMYTLLKIYSGVVPLWPSTILSKRMASSVEKSDPFIFKRSSGSITTEYAFVLFGRKAQIADSFHRSRTIACTAYVRTVENYGCDSMLHDVKLPRRAIWNQSAEYVNNKSPERGTSKQSDARGIAKFALLSDE